jgi:hypothetical protein
MGYNFRRIIYFFVIKFTDNNVYRLLMKFSDDENANPSGFVKIEHKEETYSLSNKSRLY